MSDQQQQNGSAPEEETTNPLHEDFISSAPEELREAATELAPVWDAYVQNKFTEAAEFRKQYEPFGDSLQKVTPEDVQDYLAFKEIQNDPTALKAWHEQWGLTLRNDHPELFDENDDFLGGETDPRSAAELAALRQELQEIKDWRSEQAQTEAANEATAFVNTQITGIKTEYPDLTDDDVDSICVLSTKYIPKDGSKPPEDFIKQGFKDFQRIVGQTERELFKAKENQPVPAMHGGRSSTTPSPITSFEGANEAARRAIIESMKQR